MRFLLVGNYGVGNLGDEALKEYFLRAFPDVEWQVVSASPQRGELPRLPFGFRSLFAPWWKTLRALWHSNGMVFGGGTLFTDLESSRACFLWGWHAFVAWIFRKPFFLAFQGVGPFRTGAGGWCARWVFRHAACVSVRDEGSLKRVQSWGLNRKVIQTFDPVLSLIQSQDSNDRSQNVFIIIPRNNSDTSFHDRAVQRAREHAGEEVILLSLKPDDSSERGGCMRLANAIGAKARIVPVRSLPELVACISRASCVLAQRYHGALVARALGIPLEVVPQGEGDKLAELQDGMSLEELLALVERGREALHSVLFSAS